MAAIFAAAMSSSLNSIAAAFTEDLYKPFVPRATDRHILNVSRIVTIVAGVVQIVVGLALRHQTESALSTALIAMSVGLAVVLWVRFVTAVAWPWYTVIGAMTTVLIGAPTSRLER